MLSALMDDSCVIKQHIIPPWYIVVSQLQAFTNPAMVLSILMLFVLCLFVVFCDNICFFRGNHSVFISQLPWRSNN